MAEPEKEKPATSALEDAFPDVDVPHLTALVQLLYQTGNNVEDIEDVDATPYVNVSFKDGSEYYIMEDSEADEFARKDVEEMFDDMGRDAFNVQWEDFVMNEGDFEMALNETIDNYIEDIREEAGDDPESGGTRLDEEMIRANAASEDEFHDYLASQWCPDEDYIHWYVDEFGNEAFMEFASVDIEALAKYVIDTDGRGNIIAGYDGYEIDLPGGYYAYRTN